MSIPGSANPLMLGGGGAEPYQIEQALRFRGINSSYLAKLQRTISTSGDNYKMTWSGWFKDGGDKFRSHWAFAQSNGNHRIGTYIKESTRVIESDYGGIGTKNRTTGWYYDPSAWYHFVWVLDMQNGSTYERSRFYINGERAPESPAGSYNQNTVLYGNQQGSYQIIGNLGNGNFWPWNGYMAKVEMVDGQALDPDSFAEYDDNGAWVPKEYSGSYGTTGFYLKFDPSATNGIGHDHSGNGNNFTPTGFETTTTSSLNYDVVTDTPTKNTSNWNPLFSTNQSNSDQLNSLNIALEYANQRATQGGNVTRGGYATGPLNIGGKYYWECRQGSSWGGQTGCRTYAGFGVPRQTAGISTSLSQWIWYGLLWQGTGRNQSSSTSATIYWNGSSQSTISLSNDWRPGRVAGIAIDTTATSSNVKLYVDGTLVGTGSFNFGALPEDARLQQIYTAIGSQPNQFSYLNAGSQPFQYTPPSGHVAPNTYNMPEPTIKNGGEYFNAVTYTGNGGTQAITGVGFQPDLLAIKRLNAAVGWQVFNSSVTNFNYLQFDSASAESGNSGGSGTRISSLDTDGFTLGSGNGDTNGNTNTYVAYCWKKSATAGFDIVTYTGNGTAGRTVSHSLGVKPSMMIVKCRNALASWQVYHRYMGATKVIWLDQNQAANTSSVRWNNTEPTASVFTLGTDGGMNQSGRTYVAFLFAEVEGFSRFGDYEANGNSTRGPFVYTGFTPRFIMVKDQEAQGEWYVKDTARSPLNPDDKALKMNLTDQDSDNSIYRVHILSNGFKIDTSNTSINNNSKRYIYMAFAERPFKYATQR